jgi:hypothetical protein
VLLFFFEGIKWPSRSSKGSQSLRATKPTTPHLLRPTPLYAASLPLHLASLPLHLASLLHPSPSSSYAQPTTHAHCTSQSPTPQPPSSSPPRMPFPAYHISPKAPPTRHPTPAIGHDASPPPPSLLASSARFGISRLALPPASPRHVRLRYCQRCSADTQRGLRLQCTALQWSVDPSCIDRPVLYGLCHDTSLPPPTRSPSLWHGPVCCASAGCACVLRIWPLRVVTGWSAHGGTRKGDRSRVDKQVQEFYGRKGHTRQYDVGRCSLWEFGCHENIKNLPNKSCYVMVFHRPSMGQG